MSEHLRKLVAKDVDRQAGELVALSRAIHADPELAFAERRACERVSGYAAAAGFAVRNPLAGLDTAFAATIGTGELHIALFAEYDALPELGHACGHNIISAVSAGAAVALAPLVDELDITLTLFGTPAEEHGAGKVLLLDAGAFDSVHAGLMVHPGPFEAAAPATTALARLAVRAVGRAAHAGAAYLGVNAADALLIAQTALGLLRQHLPPGDQVHGVVTSAGTAPNVVPDLATADYMLRAPDSARLRALETRIRACFAAGGLATGAKISVEHGQPPLDRLVSDEALLGLWSANRAEQGHVSQPGPPVPISTDLGNVSARIPCIHPIVGIGSWPAVNHQREFAAAAVSSAADDTVVSAAAALAATVVDAASDRLERRRLLGQTETE